LVGNCFNSITANVSFSYIDEYKVQLRAIVALDLAKPTSTICIESLQFSTTFSDKYKPIYLGAGHYTYSFDFLDLRDVIDIHKNGLRMFTYCSSPISVLSSFLQTTLLLFGSDGASKYIPFFNSKPTEE